MEINNKTINPEYIYLTIPNKYVCVYHKLLILMADFGKGIVDDCSANCKHINRNLISLWNIFQSALACNSLERYEEADFLINHIGKQIDSIYRGVNNDKFEEVSTMRISKDGDLCSFVICNYYPLEDKFYLNDETGELNVDLNSLDNNKYKLENDELIVNHG